MSQPVPEEDLHAYVDNQLGPDRRAIVESLLRQDRNAWDRVSAFTVQRHGLRTALVSRAEAPLPAALDLTMLISQREARRRSSWRLAAGVVLALGLGGSGGWLLHGTLRPQPNDVAELVQEAVANHMVYTADDGRPTELGANQLANLSSWVSDRLKLPLTAPDLTAAGFRFMGGRLAATPEGPAGMFMYRDDHAVWLTVFVRPFPGAPSARMTPVESTGLEGCAWIQKGVGYMVVAHLQASRVWQVAHQVQRQLAAPI